MNALLLNRDGFQMPGDGWYQLAPLGEFAHAGAGVVQVVDAEACAAMAARFEADAAVPNFAGLLVDFDHFSLSGEMRSEAAGWIVAVVFREGKADGSDAADGSDKGRTGLWAKIRWSDVGEEAVRGGRYRFLSPVWARGDCVELGTDPASGWARVRPVRLLNAAVTNDPNLKGLVPLANTSRRVGARDDSVDFFPLGRAGRQRPDGGDGESEASGGRGTMKRVIEKLMNHLGLAEDTAEDVVLEKMAGLPAADAVAEMQNSLTQAQGERDQLQTALTAVRQELVNRDLAEFEGVISAECREFWSDQLMANREQAVGALRAFAKGKAAGGEKGAEGGNLKPDGGTRRPLHNRATARPVIPGQGGGEPEADSRAVRIRNRAHEICKAEKVPFGQAFRRAEKEVSA